MQILKLENGAEVQLFDKEERNKWYDKHAHREDGTHSAVYDADFSIEKYILDEQNKLSEDHF